MRSPKDIAVTHSQIRFGSCTSWGVEMILLSFERKLPSPTLQERFPNGCGFGDDIKRILKDDFGIVATDHAFGSDFGGFERSALAAIKTGGLPSSYFSILYLLRLE